ncbi:MAG: MFS transporter [Burkholderiales bacterium]|nr:MFS transporter [Burkholderiales bacterium]
MSAGAAPGAGAREGLLLAALAGVQFSQILDFMILMPLGAQLMRLFGITPTQFGLLVSVYTFAAALMGFMAALVVDRFDRRTTLIVLYACFGATTLVAATAQSYAWLLGARAAAGAFGGVLGATVFAIVGDAIPEARRGRALGVVMSAFAVASIAGVPIALYLAGRFGWRAPYFMLTALAVAISALIAIAVPRVRGHVASARARRPLAGLAAVFGRASHRRTLAFTALVTLSGFLVVPFVAPYLVLNVGVSDRDLPIVYFVGGIATFFFVRRVGGMADRHGRHPVFAAVAALSAVGILVTTHLPPLPLWAATIAAVYFMATLSGRFVPAMAIITSAVAPAVRGSFMSFNAAVQQLAAGIASFAASTLVGTDAAGRLTHYGTAGLASVAAIAAAIALARTIHRAPGAEGG